MAALRGTLIGDRERANSDATSHRLADRHLTVKADTWQTFATIELARDGSGRFSVRNERGTLATVEWSAETAELPLVRVGTVGDRGYAAGILGGLEE